jgi:hypothetical protein
MNESTELTAITKKFVNESEYLKKLTEDEKLLLRIEISLLMLHYAKDEIVKYHNSMMNIVNSKLN